MAKDIYSELIDRALADDDFATKFVAMVRKNMLKQEAGSEGYEHLCKLLDQFYELKKAHQQTA
jgi:hypothetical protein